MSRHNGTFPDAAFYAVRMWFDGTYNSYGPYRHEAQAKAICTRLNKGNRAGKWRAVEYNIVEYT